MRTITKGIEYDERDSTYRLEEKTRSRHLMTVLTKDDHCGRGEYAEELDVRADSVGEARRIAKAVLENGFQLDLRISRIEILS